MLGNKHSAPFLAALQQQPWQPPQQQPQTPGQLSNLLHKSAVPQNLEMLQSGKALLGYKIDIRFVLVL